MKKDENFIIDSSHKHNNFYDYSKVEYFNSKTKVEIICPIHGSFLQTPNHHKRGSGCNECSSNKKMNTESFIKKSKEIHSDKYGYSKVNYINNKTKVIINCPFHGEIEQTPNSHLNGCGCYICSNKENSNKRKLLEKCNICYNVCDEHGISIHKKHYNNCPVCIERNIDEELNKRKNILQKKLESKHNKLKFNLDGYINSKSIIEIECNIHGKSNMKVSALKYGSGCNKCKIQKNTDKFINEANRIHNNLYDYSNVEYIKSLSKVNIICSLHGEFKQTPLSHLKHNGCPKCKKSSGERIVSYFLDKNGIEYNFQKRFDGCKNKNTLPFDFYIPKYNLCIEYDGLQHYKPVKKYGGKKAFLIRKNNDNIKNIFCSNNGIDLLRIRYDENVFEKLNNYFGLDTESDEVLSFSPYQNTINEINKFMEDKNSYIFSDLIKEIKHHYKNDKLAYSSLFKYLKKSIIKGYKYSKINNRIFIAKE